MGIIKQLDYDTAVLVAAGEMIERPASIVKELVENSIDAGAKKITVEIQNGGISLIRVSDNGCGMAKEDLPMSIKRNATSKIRTSEDIARILTLGFRGEALASIAAVADLRIRSKRSCDDVGAELEIHPGMTEPTVTDVPMADGTTIIVENLFENIPARRKFLKKDSVEGSHIADLFEKLALSNPDISMNLIIDGKSRFTTQGDSDLKHTVYSVYGSMFASELIELSYGNDVKMYGGGSVNVKITGFIGTPKNIHGSRAKQIFYVNGRNVRSKCLQAALEQAFTSYMEASRFPACVMFVTLPPEFVDVNIHPTKLEVKFVSDKAVFEAVYYAVRGALERHIPRPKLDIAGKNVGEVSYEMYKMLNSFVPLKDGAEQKTEKPVYNNLRNVKIGQLSIEDSPAETATQYSPSDASEAITPQIETDKARLLEYELKPRDVPSGDSKNTPEVYLEKIPEKLDEELTANHGMPPSSQKMYHRELPQEIDDFLSSPPEKNIRVKPLDQMSKEEYADAKVQTMLFPAASRKDVPDIPKLEDIELEYLDRLRIEARGSAKYKILGEAFLSYVIVESGDKIIFIDKHAAHERILFEELKSNNKLWHEGKRPARQMLLTALELEFTAEECRTVAEYEDDITALGFDFMVIPGQNKVSLMSIPVDLDIEESKTIFETVVYNISQGTGNAQITRELFFEKTLYQAACKAAIKIGRAYGEEHIRWICDRLLLLDYIKVCPHGRPVAFELTKSQLERGFKRI